MMTAGQWIFNLARALEVRSGPQVVELLNPKLQIKGKDKVDYEQIPQEFMQAKRLLNHAGIAEDPA